MSTFQKALFLYNGNAGGDVIEDKLAQTIPILSQAIKQLTVIQTNSVEDAKRTCEMYAKQVELIIILGGDGTVHACINKIASLKERPILAVLPGGTSNDFSRMMLMPQSLEEAAQTILEGTIMDIDIGKADERYFLNFWGVGLVTETSQNIDPNQKKNFGVLSYFMSTIKTVSQAKSFTYNITTRQDSYNGEAVMILVLNGKFIGTRELPITSIHPSDGLLDVLIVKNSNLASFRELLSMNNPEMDTDNLREVTYFQTDYLEVYTEEEKEVDTDGEIAAGTPSTIEVVPSHLKMICGSVK
ncbi:YegS/Rv2252/BmrU family lipid kinase [Agaribacter marinus]|uniref:YegS/Rv2252/BmrU family lipid kinase n=1 Tax=Virgibacillus salarius TaxID=447199 RepID=A0A941DW58_9BACI|nr:MULTISPECIES: YegS/Rv2252/BmrU family lipid kinase [Bacillaceae]MBR7796229.1 YegS/Rv2252/BmrU family lipid kinase [Virgibacillus salarius]MDY7045138.1 YegS/Rv2252/BmrU family lipid kinase [Virgibacillus sp. M23]NAZ08937.1 YegS/Rv2252/BmrU family lipid kinase [Agaribacter marinus]